MTEALRQAVDRFYHRCLSEAERRGVEPYRVMMEYIKSNRDMNPWALSIIWTNLSKRFKMSEELDDSKRLALSDIGGDPAATALPLSRASLEERIIQAHGSAGTGVVADLEDLAARLTGDGQLVHPTECGITNLTTVPVLSGGYSDIGIVTKSNIEFTPMISVDCGFDVVDTQFRDNQASLAAILNGIVSHDRASPEIRQAAENLLNLVSR